MAADATLRASPGGDDRGGKTGGAPFVGLGMGYHEMTDEQAWTFLATMPPHTGKVATTRKDGRPHLAPVWYAVNGRSVVFMTHSGSLKGRNLRRDPRAALCVDDERPPFSFVTVEGVVELSDDRAEVRHWAAVIGGRYMGEDQAAAYGERNGVPGELVVHLSPIRIFSAADVAS